MLVKIDTHKIHRSQASQGFTLIELLIVITIIALLSAILFPAFATARGKARQTTCASDERQLGMAFQQYATDNEETLPHDITPIYGQGWAGMIYSYVKDGKVFGCPDDPSVPGPGRSKLSYAMNGNIMGGTSAQYGFTGDFSTLGSHVSPANTVLLFEIQGNTQANTAGVDLTSVSENASGTANGSNAANGGVRPNTDWDNATYATGIIGANNNLALTRIGTGVHTDGSNFLACDGHVKWLRGSSVSGGGPALNPTQSEFNSPARNGTLASGTAKMQLGNGKSVAMTFSPI